MNMKVSDFDYELPKELIAQEPVQPRDHSRLMVIRRDRENFEHTHFYRIIDYLEPGDLLVMNDSKVIPARLLGKKSTGAKVEIVLIEKVGSKQWKAIVRPGSKIKRGNVLLFEDLQCEVVEHCDDSTRILEFTGSNPWEKIRRIGKLPIPPYISKYPDDPNLYQTVYAKKDGSVAAPTAGLHFTDSLLKKLKEKGIKMAFVTLHVGLGTFRPVKVENVEDHVMHSEFYTLPEETVELIKETKRNGNRVIAVGTTVVRTLEAVAQKHNGKLVAESGRTDIFIYPPYEFKVIDGLITNFHLPKSTLLMLVAAFAGHKKILKAYNEAIKLRYRFFSFGDACFIY
ncbi:MAG: S-adenosylmethionine:tRNA ribosyltransferase-isomerase [Kosmotoga sp.]|nr:S-adenosylmethionine:tRNA ribosyltransferase-isomerase [Kosmotoga sp.]